MTRALTPEGVGAPAPEPLLELRGIDKAFGGAIALAGIDFTLLPGEVHALAGENGAGKSTFVKVVAGAHAPDAGVVVVGGVEYAHLTPRLAREQRIAVVHQEFNLLPDLSVAENLFLGDLPKGRLGTVSARRARERAGALLQRLGSPLDPRQLVGDLTVAEQQLVEIAKALAIDAQIIVMDEPSTVLSLDELDVLYGVLFRLREEGRGIIYITHRLNEIITLSDRVTVFKDGRHVSTSPTAEIDQDELVRRMVGRPLVDLFPHRQATLGPPVLEVRSVSVPNKLADVSLTVHRGEIVGLAGLGGSGRTTLARAIVGLEKVSEGSITLAGSPAPASVRACARQGLVMVPEDRKAHGILPGRSVSFNLTLGRLSSVRRFGLLSRRREASFAQGLVDDYNVRPGKPGMQIQNLSGGNQQKVVLARWMALSPDVVVLDEPTRGVDVGAKAEIYSIIENLSRTGVGVLLASSDLTELIGTCDRIVVLREGGLAAEFDRSQASEEAILRAAAQKPAASSGEELLESDQPGNQSATGAET